MFTRWRIFAALVEVLVAICLLPVGAHAQTDNPDGYRLSGPVHGNLAIYFVHGASRSGPVPLTLQEAMEKKVVEVREIGRVNEVLLENVGNRRSSSKRATSSRAANRIACSASASCWRRAPARYRLRPTAWRVAAGRRAAPRMRTCSQAPAPSCRRAGPSSKWREPQPGGRKAGGGRFAPTGSLAERRTDSRQAVEHSGQFGCGTSLADEPAIVAGERPPRARAGAVSRRAQAAG